MKRGQKVHVCHDGKWGRRVLGEVVQQHNGHHITVRFTPRGETEPLTFKARRRKRIAFERRRGCITYLSRPTSWCASASDGWWYSIWAASKGGGNDRN